MVEQAQRDLQHVELINVENVCQCKGTTKYKYLIILTEISLNVNYRFICLTDYSDFDILTKPNMSFPKIRPQAMLLLLAFFAVFSFSIVSSVLAK